MVSPKMMQAALKVAETLGEKLAPELTAEATSVAEKLLREVGFSGALGPQSSKALLAMARQGEENLKSLSARASSFDANLKLSNGLFELQLDRGSRESAGAASLLNKHEFGHIRPEKSPFFDSDEALKIIPREPVEQPAQSMTPKAYKVIQNDGSSIWDHGTNYPLPERLPNGQWQPGNWVEPGKSKTLEYLQKSLGGERERGLYISSNPNVWKASQPGMVTFEVEVGDKKSQALWNAVEAPFRIDFTAQRMRLLRPISPKELASIEVTPEDLFGAAINNLRR